MKLFPQFNSMRIQHSATYLIGLILLLGSFNAKSFHIVGGEIEMLHIEGFRYQMNVIQYFDRAQQFNPGPEAQIFVFTYRKVDRELMRIDTLLLTSQAIVEYTNPVCAIASLQTERVLFTKEVNLDPDLFNHPDGYSVVWERCCRNGSVVNVNNPLNTGMTYVVDIPPVIKDGVPFVNSSPSLFPPLSDFACVGELYYADFAGSDLDGDSIVYSLSEPLNSSSTVALPIPQFPDPNRKIVWAAGIDNQNIIPGNPSLNISSDGFVTVRPNNPGLYVFAALAKEFRDGVQIGEVRRDFQLLVTSECEPGTPPKVSSKLPDGSLYEEGDVITYTVSDAKCFEFIVTDNEGDENVSLKALGVNFNNDVTDIFSFTTGQIGTTEDSLKVEVCIPDCPFIQDEIFQIDLIAMDDACPLPRMDTLRMSFFVQPPPNTNPFFDNPDEFIQAFVDEDGFLSLAINGQDSDGDTLDLDVRPLGFNFREFGMSVTDTTGIGSLQTIYNLDANCLTHDFGIQNEFEVDLALEDRDECRFINADSLSLALEVILPPNTDPIVSTSTGDTLIETSLDDLIEFSVFVVDNDGDTVLVRADVEDFDLADLGISFNPTFGEANTSSVFSMDLTCSELDLMGMEEFTVNFIGTDQDKCKVPNADTLAVTFKLNIPFNNPPVLSTDGVEGEVIEARVNTPIELPIIGTDLDGDSLSLALIDGFVPPDEDNFEFLPESGFGNVSSILNWTPRCSLLGPDDSPQEYTVDFVVHDNSCPYPKSDSLTLTFRVFDSPVSFDNFTPPNVVTPNGDAFNENFSLSRSEDENFNLPYDSCDDVFNGITIVNRYGKIVFESSIREFEWVTSDASPGTYYYILSYTTQEYRGTVSVLN
ncbi:MAG: gliding motility-associated C-terminal domain-containing protein [Cyclobacteriaceae bacterium]